MNTFRTNFENDAELFNSLPYKVVVVGAPQEGKKKVKGNLKTTNWTIEQATNKLDYYKKLMSDHEWSVRFAVDLEGSDVFCLDIDAKTIDGESDYFEQLADEFPIFEYCAYSKGTTKGYHCFFKKNEEIKDKLGKNIVEINLKYKIDLITSIIFMKPNEVFENGMVDEYSFEEFESVFTDKPLKSNGDGKPKQTANVEFINQQDQHKMSEFLNKLLDFDFGKWSFDSDEMIFKHDCFTCCVQKEHNHSALDHSCVFFNEGKYLVANCPSHGSKKIKLSKKQAKELRLFCGIKNIDDEEAEEKISAMDILIQQMESKHKLKPYAETKMEFETKHALIEEGTTFLTKKQIPGQTDSFSLRNKTDFKILTQNIQIVKPSPMGPELINFFEEWLKEPKRKTYLELNCCPNGLNEHSEPCPDYIFNTWQDYQMEVVKDYEEHPEAVKEFKDLLFHLAGKNQEYADYFEKWIAHIIKYPNQKTEKMIILVSLEGCGKGTLIKILKQMLGKKKMFESTDPSKEIWGQFNTGIDETIIISLNEVNKKDMSDGGKLKSLITEHSVRINNKGVKPYETSFFGNFMVSTNNIDPINVKGDNRRFVFFDSSAAKKHDKQYWIYINELIKDQNFIKTIYEHLKHFELGENEFRLLDKPVSQYEKEVIEANRSPVELFIEDLLINPLYRDTSTARVKKTDLFGVFSKFTSKLKLEYTLTQQKFTLHFGKQNLSWIQETKIKGIRYWVIDFEEGRKLNDINLDEEDDEEENELFIV